jgi:hypothetical protein
MGVIGVVVELPPAVREACSTAGGRALGVAGDPFDISVGGTDVRRITGHGRLLNLRGWGEPHESTRGRQLDGVSMELFARWILTVR